MPTLYNVSTKKPEELDGDALNQALAAGTHSYETGTQVVATAPDGTLGHIPSENVPQALQAGYKIETPTQEAIRGAVDDFKTNNGAVLGGLKVAAYQGINQLALGLPQVILDHTQDPLAVAKAEAIRKEYELSNIAGGTAGFVTSLFAGAPLFKGAAKAGEVATAAATNLAEKLGVTSGAEIGTRTASQFARDAAVNIAAKGVGGTVEGALMMAPQAVTETMLGDPHNAAESLLAGGAIGGLFGGGGAAVKELFGLGKAAVKRGAEAVGAAQPTAELGVRKLLEAATGVPEENIEKLASNWDRISANPPPEIEGLKDQIDAEVARYHEAEQLASQELQNKQFEHRQNINIAVDGLKHESAPSDVIANIGNTLKEASEKLGQMSADAEETLTNKNIQIPKDDIYKIYEDSASHLMGTQQSESKIAAARQYKAYTDRLSQYGETLDGNEARDLLRQLRSDADFNIKNGQMNTQTDRFLKQASGTISDLLKTEVPEYAAQMAKMSEYSKAVQEASQVFGTEQSATSALNSLRTPRGQINQRILEDLQRVTGTDLTSGLEKMNKAKDLLEKVRATGSVDSIVPELLPNQVAELKQIEAKHMFAKADLDAIKRLTPGRTEALVKRGEKMSIEDQRAMQRLSTNAGTNFQQAIDDRHLLNSFDKAYKNGSAKVNLYALLGGSLGAVVGGPAGYVAGSTAGGLLGSLADHNGGAMIKKLMEKSPDLTGLLFVEKKMKQLGENLDTIPDVLNRMADNPKAKIGKSASIGAIGRAIMPDYKPKKDYSALNNDRAKHLNEANTTMASLMANPSAASQHFANMTYGLSSGGAPNISEAFNAKMALATSYLHNSMPKPNEPMSPFAGKKIYRPNDMDVTAFEQKMAVVQDPFVVIKELENGTLTRNHIDALQNVYPYVYSEMQKAIQKAAMSNPKPLSYHQRLKVGMLMGTPIDRSANPDSVQYFQSGFGIQGEPIDAKQGFKVSLSQQSMTPAQNVENKS